MKMKVLTIQVDVSRLTDEEISDLKYAMEAQTEEAGLTDDGNASRSEMLDAPILNSGIREIEVDDDPHE